MTRSEPAVLAIVPVLVAALFLAMGTAIVLPQPAAAQCAECAVTGLGGDGWPGPINNPNGLGVGQPGGDLQCVDGPEGMTDCQGGRDWCETLGSVCSALMFLDFTEGGAAYRRTFDGAPADGTQVINVVGLRTCDGILLRGARPQEEVDQPNVILTVVL